MKPILIDCDGVLCGFVAKCLEHINNRYGSNYTVDQITQDIRKVVPWDNKMEKLVKSKGFAQTLDIFPEAEKAVNSLLSSGKKVLFVTSPYKNSPTWCHDRTKWLEKYFGATRDDIIFTHDKRYVQGSILIDDHPRNIKDWSEYNNKSSILFKQPWNNEEVKTNNNIKIYRTNDWNKILKALLK